MSLQPFPQTVCSRAVVLRIDNIDTDVITPIARVVQGAEAVVAYAFEPLRFGEDGARLESDPFADPARAGAQILITGDNFGCGSSRETAAWAVKGMGFRAIIATGYGDIFYSNALKNSVLPIRLTGAEVGRLGAIADRLDEITIDLRAQRITAAGFTAGFEIGPLQKEMLALGLDDLGVMNSRADALSAYEARDVQLRPWARDRHQH